MGISSELLVLCESTNGVCTNSRENLLTYKFDNVAIVSASFFFRRT